LKILFVVPYLGFAGVISDMLAGHLANKGHELFVVGHLPVKNRHMFLEEIQKLEEKNIRFCSIQSISISIPVLVTEFPYFLSLEKILKEVNPDLVHINCLPFLSTFQAAKIARKFHIPSVVHVHGVIGKSNKLLDIAQYSFIKTIGHSVFRDATFLVCLTENDAKEIQSCGCPPEKIRLVPNGVDVDKFTPCSKIGDNLLLWAGRFVPAKGLKYLIEALHFVVKNEPAVKLVLVGDGPFFSKVQNMVKKFDLEKNLIFKGRVSHDDLPDILGTSSLYVLPSLKEGMPFALLEAMACGNAVICSDIPGINDVITHGENGLLVPTKNSKALANAILRLLIDGDLRKKLGNNARQLMVEKYNWNIISEKIEQVYHDAINEKAE
jgi:glycosyltransferase involved in cell wall biosynthesis